MRIIEEGHIYGLPNLDNGVEQAITFIKRFDDDGHDGTTNEEVLLMLIDRISYLQSKVSCRENALVITKLEEALMWLNYRTGNRVARGVEGTNAK